jgi:hypothetical protein
MTFIKELKRRNVFKVGVAYLVGAWLIIQVVETVFPLFGFGNEPARIVVIILAVGFIFTLVISWVYELTPDGLKKEKDIRGKQRITRGRGNRLNFVIIGLLVMAVGFFAYDKFVLGPGRDAAATLIAVARLAEVREMVGERQFGKAYARALQLEPSFTDVSLSEKLWQAVTHNVNLTSTPSGAHVSIRAYNSEENDWEELGQTPLEEARVPQGFVRIRMALEGYQTLVVASWEGGEYRLEPVGSLPQDMLYVEGGDFKTLMPELGYPSINLSDFLIDTYEVSNQQFMQFVDADGYSNAEYWEHPFILDGREFSFEDAMGLFKDQTGRSGPGTWEFGTYADGKASHPVGGISWYEAAAFARFKGKHLPTLYHWYWAAFIDVQPFILNEFIVPSSNFEGEGAVPVGTLDGISSSGTVDMAGNVREWVWNKTGEDRFLLGGGWNDPKYTFSASYALSPFNRSELNGFRLITLLDNTNLELARNPVPLKHRNYLVEEPVADEIFEVYRRFYTYDATPLNAVVIEREDAEHWTRERIELDAAYGNERLTAFLYIPKGVEPPYETVVYFPGASAIFRRESPAVDDSFLGFFLLRSGRAILFPLYKGTFERGTLLNSDFQDETNFYREHVIHWSKDIGRSLDYLETRSDITMDRLGYFGLSWGSAVAPIMIAIEPRIKAAVLVVGGLISLATQPEVDPFNFLPRVMSPTRMVNLSADYFFPLETSALPFYELLGAKPKDMVHMEGAGHYVPRNRVITETLDWFDRFPVRQP